VRIKRTDVAVLLSLFLVMNVFIFAYSYFNSLAPSESGAAGSARVILTLASPLSVTNIANGSTINVALSAQTTTGANVAEVVLNYDSTVLTAQSITESNNILALNKSTSTPGKVTVDIANGVSGDLPANTTLVTFAFTVLNNTASNTTLTLDSTSTFGYPNLLSTTNGYGTLKLVFKPTVCGDSTIQTPNDSGVNEVCDKGAQNGVVCTAAYGQTCDWCNSTCTTLTTVTGPRCGDGTKQTNEVCDSGAQNGVVCTAPYGGTCNWCNNTCSAQTTVTGPKCGDGIKQTNEACDDGNLSNYDTCSSSCQNTCGTDQVWIGSKCAPIGCVGDYDRNGEVGITDFGVLGQNFKKAGIACNLDIKVSGGLCFLDIQDFQFFSNVYIKGVQDVNVCRP